MAFALAQETEEIIPHNRIRYGRGTYVRRPIHQPNIHIVALKVTHSMPRTEVRSELEENAAQNMQFKFSNRVHRAFWFGISALTVSGLVSLFGLVTEYRPMSYFGAVLLAIALLFLDSWIRQANVERRETKLG